MKTIPWCFLVASALNVCAAYADDTPVDTTSSSHMARAAIQQGFEFQHVTPTMKASPSVTATSVSLPAAQAKAIELDPANDLTDAIQAPPVQMPVYQARDIADHTYRELNESVAVRELLAPCVIFRKDVSHGLELQAIGAPVAPLVGETGGHEIQARFPVATVAW